MDFAQYLERLLSLETPPPPEPTLSVRREAQRFGDLVERAPERAVQKAVLREGEGER
jgi:hypothetical protein